MKAKATFSVSNGQTSRLWRIVDAIYQGSVLQKLPIREKLDLNQPVIRWMSVYSCEIQAAECRMVRWPWILGSMVLAMVAAPKAQADDWAVCKEPDGHYDESISACSAIIKLGKESSSKLALAYSNRGWGYHGISKDDQALADLNKAISLNPKLADAYSRHGTVYYFKHKLDRAITDFDKAIALNPKLANAYESRGMVFDDKGDNVRAISDCDKALTLYGKDEALGSFQRKLSLSIVLFYRAGANERAGHTGEARADFQKLLELDPGNEDAKVGLQRLK